jgi:DNA-binding winged helix-turn-helix (wHTH) protein
MHATTQLVFDHYRLDSGNEQLWCDDRAIPLPGKAFTLLRYLAERAGQLVTKAELFERLWPGTVVSDGALTYCIVELRKTLGDNAKTPRFIETVHRRGAKRIRSVPDIRTAAPSSLDETRSLLGCTISLRRRSPASGKSSLSPASRG